MKALKFTLALIIGIPLFGVGFALLTVGGIIFGLTLPLLSWGKVIDG